MVSLRFPTPAAQEHLHKHQTLTGHAYAQPDLALVAVHHPLLLAPLTASSSDPCLAAALASTRLAHLPPPLRTLPRRTARPTYRPLLARLRHRPLSMSAPASSNVSELLATAHWAALAHSQQRRKSGSQPAYIQHPLHVATLLAAPTSSLHPDPPLEVLQAAILHDTVEDTDVTEQDLLDRFGPVVTRIGARLPLLLHPLGPALALPLADASPSLAPRSSRMLGRQGPQQGAAQAGPDRHGASQV